MGAVTPTGPGRTTGRTRGGRHTSSASRGPRAGPTTRTTVRATRGGSTRAKGPRSPPPTSSTTSEPGDPILSFPRGGVRDEGLPTSTCSTPPRVRPDLRREEGLRGREDVGLRSKGLPRSRPHPSLPHLVPVLPTYLIDS